MNAANWTPRTLAVRTFAVFRERPWLAVPVLVADLLGLAVLRIPKALLKPLLYFFFSQKASVLGSARNVDLGQGGMNKAFLIATPMLWVCYFLSAYLYSAALLGTFSLLRQPDREASLFSTVVAAVREKSQRLLHFALIFWLLLILAPIAMSLLFSVTSRLPAIAPRTAYTIGVLIGLLVEFLIAFIITRPALKLLRPPSVDLPNGAVRLAVLTALTTLIAQATLIFLIGSATPLLSAFFPQPTVPAILFRDAALSLIGAIPYAFLFIALSLLAESPEPDPISEVIES